MKRTLSVKNNKLLLFLLIIAIFFVSIYIGILLETKNEGFYNNYSIKDAICHKYKKLSPNEELKNIDKDCKILKEESCNSSKCCVWLNEDKCVGGDKGGPTWREKLGKIKNYSWKNTCYGKCEK